MPADVGADLFGQFIADVVARFGILGGIGFLVLIVGVALVHAIVIGDMDRPKRPGA